MWWEGGFVRGVASLEGDRVVVFYHLCASEIWLDIRVAFGGSGHLREGNTVLSYFIFTLFLQKLFVLLDLIGSADVAFKIFFPDTSKEFENLVKIGMYRIYFIFEFLVLFFTVK